LRSASSCAFAISHGRRSARVWLTAFVVAYGANSPGLPADGAVAGLAGWDACGSADAGASAEAADAAGDGEEGVNSFAGSGGCAGSGGAVCSGCGSGATVGVVSGAGAGEGEGLGGVVVSLAARAFTCRSACLGGGRW
jgi:hypothetical protein